MTIVVKHTFLDVSDHKFMESPSSGRRCQSLPRAWKRSLSQSSSSSTQSGFSVSSLPGSSTCTERLERSPGNALCIDKVIEFGNDANAGVESTAEADGGAAGGRTKLKRESPAFTPVATDTRFDAVTYAVYIALLSGGQSHQVNIEKGIQGASPTLITVQLQNGPGISARCYDAVHLAKQVLEEMTSRLSSTVLLSKRVQKEDYGYSLRSSIACVPCSAEGSLCWDLYKTGCCPRRHNCQWYHPQESDIGRLKISIRSSEEVAVAARSEQPAVRHTISLGELVQ